MKKKSILFVAMAAVLFACNNEGASDAKTDSSATTMSSTNANVDTSAMIQQTIPTDSATSVFLMKAADGGLAEVAAGQLAQKKSENANVQRFAMMMVQDHSAVNDQVKSLAAARDVMIPVEPSAEHKKMAADAEKKTGAAFDKAYMDMMLAGHKKTISLFETASKDSKDDGVKSFITATIPKLKAHLDSVIAVQKTLKK